MIIQYCSDLHLEFPENWKYLQKRPLIPSGEILLLAGDIMPFTLIDKFADFISFAADNFSAVYWIPGNHEYYNSDIRALPFGVSFDTVRPQAGPFAASNRFEPSSPFAPDNPVEPSDGFAAADPFVPSDPIESRDPIALFEKIRSNFFVVNNQQILYKNCNLVFSTLWSKISPRNEWDIRRSLSDFKAIRNGEQFLDPAAFNRLHEISLSFLQTVFKKPAPGTGPQSPTPGTGPQSPAPAPPAHTVVVTHHVPTFMNYPKQYRTSPLSEAFATELSGLIEDSAAGHWIYGHHHSPVPPFKIGKTELLTNQLGYVRMNEQRKFRRDATIDLRS